MNSSRPAGDSGEAACLFLGCVVPASERRSTRETGHQEGGPPGRRDSYSLLVKCDQCDKEATVHEVTVRQGAKVEKHLCEACAAKLGIGSPQAAPIEELLGKVLLAPGAAITSSGMGGGVAGFAGTSQAAPHVAGALALMLQAKPAASADELENALKGSGRPIADPGNGITTTRIDVKNAIDFIKK